MPLQNIQFPLIWPILPSRGQTGLDRISQNVEPFLTVAFAASKLPVEKIFLPDRFPGRTRPAACHVGTPEFHPPLERRYWNMYWRAEKMQVIGHNDITPHQPVIRFTPHCDEQLMDFRVRKQRTAAIHVATDILNDCLIWGFQRRQMRQLFSTGLVQRLVHNFRRDELRESLTLINKFSWGLV